MQYISEAYSTLKDKSRRAEYDRKASQASSNKSSSSSSSGGQERGTHTTYEDIMAEVLRRMQAEAEIKRKKAEAEIEELKRKFRKEFTESFFGGKENSTNQENKESEKEKRYSHEEQIPKKEKGGLRETAAKEARNGALSYSMFIDTLRREKVPNVDDLINSAEVISAISAEAIKKIDLSLYWYDSYIKDWFKYGGHNFDRQTIHKSPKVKEALLNQACKKATEGAHWFKNFADECEKYHVLDKQVLLKDEKILKILRDKAKHELSHGAFSYGLYLRQWREVGIEIEI